jgi:hypothetical protein
MEIEKNEEIEIIAQKFLRVCLRQGESDVNNDDGQTEEGKIEEDGKERHGFVYTTFRREGKSARAR